MILFFLLLIYLLVAFIILFIIRLKWIKNSFNYIYRLGIKGGELEKFLKETGIIPVYTESMLFLTSLTVLLFAITNYQYLPIIFKVFFESFSEIKNIGDAYGTILLMLLVGLFLYGMVLSIYHAFSRRKKKLSEKNKMFFFVRTVNMFAGLYAGLYLLKEAHGYLIIFPLLNIASALFLNSDDLIDANESISEENTKWWEIFAGSIVVSSIFFVSYYLLHNYWAITFSLCMVYATNLNELLNRLFYRKSSYANT